MRFPFGRKHEGLVPRLGNETRGTMPAMPSLRFTRCRLHRVHLALDLTHMKTSRRLAVFWLVILLSPVLATGQSRQTARDGETAFSQVCATCHAEGQGSAPARQALAKLPPEAIFDAMSSGRMWFQSISLTEPEQRAVAVFLAGRPFAPASSPEVRNRCTTSAPMRGLPSPGDWNGWGNGPANARFQSADKGGLSAADLPKLKLKWAFGYHSVILARAQPTLAGGRLFVASDNGEVHALDPRTGCTHWTFKAQTGVRTAIVVGPYRTATISGLAAYFGDGRARAYAVDANTGQQIWVARVEEHPFAAITGGLAYHDGRVFVPTAGLIEEAQGGRPDYACCTFRGSVSALDAGTGAVVWKTYTIDEPKPQPASSAGAKRYGPAGAGIWAAPTIDAKRGALYIATGNNYAAPSQPTSDAVIALEIATGSMRWVQQLTPDDNWANPCGAPGSDRASCPNPLGPDHDFSASPALVTVAGRDLIVLPQKSGMAYALDPARQGQKVWEYRIGQGGPLGGQWGGALDDRNAYFGVADQLRPTPGGIRAVDLESGRPVWTMPPQNRLCKGELPACNSGQGAAVTAISGAVFSGSLDGGMRAYSTRDGAVIWTFDTNRAFETVNGVRATGGSLDGPGVIVGGGMLFFNAGYAGPIGSAGNVLLAFAID